jgi:predicted DNA-binding WGR domain protein
MDNLLTVIFEAHHAQRNHHRRYQITVGRDLFDDWTASICYGRVGQRGGQQRHFASPRATEIRRIISECLQRRLSATTRIGCPYQLTSLHIAEGFDGAAWLPGDVMARFVVGLNKPDALPCLP